MLIYLIKNIINDKVYVGKTQRLLNKRLIEHKKEAKKFATGKLKYNSYFYRAINKYGWNNFVTTIVEDNIQTLKELNYKEIYYIGLYNARNLNIGYNIATGGDGGCSISGEKHYLYGKHPSEETRKKLSESHMGQIAWNKGKPPSEETKNKISESLKGNIPWNKGTKDAQIPWNKKFSEEQELEIYNKYLTNIYTYNTLAAEYNCSVHPIAIILKKYKHKENVPSNKE